MQQAQDRATYDLRNQIQPGEDTANASYTDEEGHSGIDSDSDEVQEGEGEEEFEDDGSSQLSVPNESIDFDLVYSLHSFAATVEGQANVVKGDSLFLMDDSNSYWWLVRVLKTQEVGYIPAENIETPFERLARLNKHRNVDLASATQQELEESREQSRDRLRNNLSSRNGSNLQVGMAPSPAPYRGNGPDSRSAARPKSLAFSPALNVHRYPPAIWRPEEEEDEDDETEWDVEGYEDEDQDLADEQQQQMREEELLGMEPEDPMAWDDNAVKQAQGAGILAGLRPGTSSTSPVQPLRTQTSRDFADPADVTETRKLTVTPNIARESGGNEMQKQQAAAATSSAPPVALPSAVMQKQEDDRKRTREEIEALEEAARKKSRKSAAPISSATAVSNVAASPKSAAPPANGKLRKEPQPSAEDEGKKKKGSVFGGLFGRKKDKEKGKDKDKSSMTSAESGGEMSRESEDSGRSSARASSVNAPPPETSMSPTTMSALQQQQGQAQNFRNSTDPNSKQSSLEAPVTPPHVSQHASQLRQKDQQQQALYQQYLNRSPSSPPEAQPNYGLQSASAVMPGNSSIGSMSSGLGPPTHSRPRPGSLVLSPGAMDGAGFSELSVIRVFAGNNLQTEATFKTVLLNSSTSSSELVKQAIQRFRLPFGEDEGDYYLTVKQMEGSSAVLLPEEKPLGVFETLVEAAMELPKVKRSSVGSISSIASNLSMHPAIKKLPMNDFTDDSAVKFYLNRRGEEGTDDDAGGEEDETLMAEDQSLDRSQFLTVNTSGSHNVQAERFTSPSFRFAMQLVIYPTDLPEDMVFDPMTEAIVFKHTLRDRSQTNSVTSPGISQTFRRKVFVFPKNVTVAEVIELGLERFGIQEGVVDGGDEVEDKTTKRRSSVRVRYGLAVDTGTQERELSPSSKITDAYAHPPSYQRRQADKRRSVDSGQLLGSLDDVNPGDPVFILRRSISYRNSSSRRRMSAPLDEMALHQLHRESTSTVSDTSEADEPKRQPSRQEIIAAQRAAARGNQRAILTTQTNSVRGVDVLLPGNAMIRSGRYDSNDRMRYSYVEPDGETYDISDIVEEEWRESNDPNRNDLLQGAIVRNKDGQADAKLERVLSKIKGGKATAAPRAVVDKASRSASPSGYSLGQDSRSSTPVNAGRSPTPTRGISPTQRGDSRANTPTNPPAARPVDSNRRQPSIASVISNISGYATPSAQINPAAPSPMPPTSSPPPQPRKKGLTIPKDDFGVSQMMAVIELGGRVPRASVTPMDTVDELLFGRPLDLSSLHPKIRDVYADGFKQVEDMDKALDDFLQTAIRAF